ncbi:MAG: universal stress protein, partial [Kineosporiaceae bacterium]
MATSPAPVVVGFDGSEHASQALVWAATEAIRYGGRLAVVGVVDYAGVGLRGPASMAHLWLDGARDRAAALSCEGAQLARAVSPDLHVEVVARIGAPAGVLVEVAQEAELLVLGTRGRSPLADAALGSVVETVTAHAHCPVVVVGCMVKGHPALRNPVIVGVDGSDGASRAVDVAGRIARRAGAALEVLSAWTPGTAWPYDPFSAATEFQLRPWGRTAASEAVASAVTRARSAFPDVDIHACVARGRPADVLIERGARAGLLVVGSRGRGPLTTLALGSVSHAVVRSRSATCATCVVGPAVSSGSGDGTPHDRTADDLTADPDRHDRPAHRDLQPT